jgi:hypothetical protein
VVGRRRNNQVITPWRPTLQRSNGMADADFIKLRKKALGSLVCDGYSPN